MVDSPWISDIFDTSKDKKSLVNKAQLFYAVSGGVLPPRIEKAYNSAELLLANNGLTGSELEQFIGHIRHVAAMVDHYDDFDEFNDEYSDEEVDVPVDSLEISDEENELKIDDTKESTEDVLRAEIKFLKEQNKRIYVGLYIWGQTQEALAFDMDFTTDYISKCHKKLIKFFFEKSLE